MKRFTLIPETLPQKKTKRHMYEDALLQFKGLDIESARIEAEQGYATSIVCSINSVIKNSDEFCGMKAVIREGKPYLARTSALDAAIDSILEG